SEGRPRGSPGVAKSAVYGECLLRLEPPWLRVPVLHGEACRSIERTRSRCGRCPIRGEEIRKSPFSLRLVAACLPEAPDRFSEAQGELRVTCRFAPVEGGADVVVLCVDAVDPFPRHV